MAKNILISGVLSKTGAALSEAFKKAGYYVYGLDQKEDLQQNRSCDRFIRFDINQFVKDVEYRIRFTTIFDDKIPKLDVLINNASVLKLGNLKEIRLEDWQESLNVNLTGPLMLSKLFLNRLEESNGYILNIGSIHHQMTQPKYLSFSTSKGALASLTRSMAVDLKGKVRVNCISPYKGKLKKKNKKVDYPEKIAQLAVFLASTENTLLNGANLNLDDGLSFLLPDN